VSELNAEAACSPSDIHHARSVPLIIADLDGFIADDLDQRASMHHIRARRPVTVISSTHVAIDGAQYVNFASNNYLGLTHHPRMIAAAENSLRHDGLGSGAAALITGYTTRHAQAEAAIARWKGMQDAVLLPSGYQANLAAVQTLAMLGEKSGGGVRFLIDKLAHASLLDAVRGVSAKFRVFPHNHLAKLKRLLEDAPPLQLQVVLTESIFSMDGDAGDLAGLVDLKTRLSFLLLLDEAHGSGVYGPGGAGYAADLNLQKYVDISIVTLSKAMGSVGGAVCASKNFCEALVNYGRAFIYTTGVPSWIAAAASQAIDVMREEPYRQARVRALARRVRDAANAMGLEIPPGDGPIIPIILGEEKIAIEASSRLAKARLLVPAVRPPTVAKGSSRLRITLSCDHTDGEVDALLQALTDLRPG
jgi:8-amino-7-oxononanoate synthase